MSEAGARKLLRREEVEERFGLSRSWIYSEMRAGRFPEPVRIGKRAVRWRVADLDEWAAGRPVAQGEIGQRR
ncbi:MAG: AlpA family phage regulatory protein [Rhodospirillales bacterium]|nr:AlpA family phage regulatory protein [Rhodospirillales bacterium]